VFEEGLAGELWEDRLVCCWGWGAGGDGGVSGRGGWS
jgi:hypothetical protein